MRKRNLTIWMLVAVAVFLVTTVKAEAVTWGFNLGTYGDPSGWDSGPPVETGFPQYDYTWEMTEAALLLDLPVPQWIDILDSMPAADKSGAGTEYELPFNIFEPLNPLHIDMPGIIVDIYLGVRWDGYGTGYITNITFSDVSGIDVIGAKFAGDLTVTPIAEPSTPPVADADGPYTIYVGDTLTLDANDSTDDDNDIVSYVWDLDDNGSFETDAEDQPTLDVNFAYLQSLGLLVDNTYNIHLKVTDSKGQSDVNESTLTILSKPATVVAVDIKPGSCPNPLNVKSSGVLPVAVLGSEDFDVNTIVPTSIHLAGVEAVRNNYEDVAAPVLDANDCNCTTDGPDGFLDLTLKFKTQLIVEAIGEVNDGDVLRLELTGVLFGEKPIEGADCILIRGKHKPFNKADINKDGVVDSTDFAIFAQNWLQSSIVDE